MPLYSYRTMNSLTEALERMARNFFDRMPLILTPDDFLSAFIAPEHVGKLREIEELVGFLGHNATKTSLVGRCGVSTPALVSFGIRPPVILPLYVPGGMQHTCPENVRDVITVWTDERLRLGHMFGDALDGLHALNEICDDKQALVTLFPCFPTIMGSISEDLDAQTTKTAQAMAQRRRASALPKLPREVKDRLLEVSAVVNSVALVKDSEMIDTPKHHARIQSDPYGLPNHSRYNIFDVGKSMQAARRASFL